MVDKNQEEAYIAAAERARDMYPGPRWDLLLDLVGNHGRCLETACLQSGISRDHHYARRRGDKEYAARVNFAKRLKVGMVEERLWDRTDDPIAGVSACGLFLSRHDKAVERNRKAMETKGQLGADAVSRAVSKVVEVMMQYVDPRLHQEVVVKLRQIVDESGGTG